MQKNLWKGLFRPENKKLRSNIFLALLAGVLLLAMGKAAEMPRCRRHCIRRQRHFAMCLRIKLQFCR